MKITSLLFTLGLSGLLNVLHAQNITEISVPKVKETGRIDSLLKKFKNLGQPASSCFVISVEEYKNEYDLTISGLRTDTSLFNLDIFQSRNEFNFFKYKGYTVFVKKGSDPYNFFRKTKDSKIFKFQWDRAKSDKIFPMGRYFCNNTYVYLNGKFESIVISDVADKITVKKLKVPIIQEDIKIDSLLDNYIGAELSNNTCFFIQSDGTADHYNFSIDKVRTDTSLVKLHILLKSNLSFFRYKGFLIFVLVENDPFELFHKATRSKKFKFEVVEPMTPPDNFFGFTWLTYKNGRLQPVLVSDR